MFCIHCGAKLDDDARFCTSCGKKVDDAQASSAVSSTVSSAVSSTVSSTVSSSVSSSAPKQKKAFGAPVFKKGEETQVEQKNKKRHYSMAMINKVLSQLHNLDIDASATAGESSFPMSDAQSTFMKLLKRGLVVFVLAFCMSLSSLAQVYKQTFDIPDYKGKLKIEIVGIENVELEKDEITGRGDVSSRHFFKANLLAKQLTVHAEFKRYEPFDSDSGYDHIERGFAVQYDGYDFSQEEYAKLYEPKVVTEPRHLRQAPQGYWYDALDNVFSSSAYSDIVMHHTYTLEEDAYGVRLVIGVMSATVQGKPDKYFTLWSYHSYIYVITPGEKPIVEVINTEASGEADVVKSDSTGRSKSAGDGGGSGPVFGDDDGTMPGWVIPTGIAVSVLGGLAALIAKIRGGGSGGGGPKQGGTPNTPKASPARKKKEEDSNDDDDDDDENITYEMRVKKDFGNTLLVGHPAGTVAARIVRIDSKGNVVTDDELTSRLKIMGDSYIQVSQPAISGSWLCAKVSAPDSREFPDTAVVTFRLSGGAGLFDNRMHFKVVKPALHFFQDNLTLPAVYDKESRLPFAVLDIAPEQIDHIEAAFSNNDYSVTIQPTSESPIVFAAVINEVCKEPMEAGQSRIAELSITVHTKGGGEITDTFNVIRLQMGLYFQCDYHVGCYLENYDHLKHNVELCYRLNSGARIAPCHTRGTFSLLSWNEKTHKVIRVLPDKDNPFKVEAVPSDIEPDFLNPEADSRSTQGVSNEEYISSLQIDAIPERVADDLSVEISLFSRQYMDTPSRRKAKIILSMLYKGEEYTAEQEVMLVSMPYRDMGNDQLTEMWKKDQEIEDHLYYIRNSINHIGAYDRLFPVVKTIDLMLEGYDPMFGYDPVQFNQVVCTYKAFCRGEIIGANADPDSVEDLGFLAETMRALATSGTQIEEWMSQHGGWKTRMAIGLVTLGWSEAALTACTVQKKMIDVVEREKNPGDEWEAFYVGVNEVAWEFLMERGTEFVFSQVAMASKTLTPNLAHNAERIANHVGGVVQEKLGYLGKDVRDVFKDVRSYGVEKFGRKVVGQVDDAAARLRNAEKELQKDIRNFNKTAVYTEDEIAAIEAYNAALQESMHTIKEYEKVYLEWAGNRTQENLKRVEEYVLKIQGSKCDQRALAQYTGKYGNNLRARFYDMQQPINRQVQKKTAEYIAEDLRKRGMNVDAEDVYAFHATNSKTEALHSGDAITRDLDVSEKVKVKDAPYDYDVPQDIADDCYARAYKEVTGLDYKVNDHSVVQKGSKEMIGGGVDDLNRAFKKDLMCQRFDDAQGVANAYRHKVNEWVIDRAEEAAEAQSNTAAHVCEEGIRQGNKLADGSVLPMAVENDVLSDISTQDIKILKSLNTTQISTPGGFDPISYNKFLMKTYGISIYDIGDKLHDIVLFIENAKTAVR